jgi:hypothetical protein
MQPSSPPEKTMRKQFCCAILLASVGAVAPAAPVDTLQWLAGCWAAVGGEAGSGEQWLAPAGGTMHGVGRTVKRGQTVEWEFVTIREVTPGQLAYVAKPHNQSEASFALLRQGPEEAVFENLEHDFPQRIIYKMDGRDRLNARIEGTVQGKLKGRDFPLQRTDCR